ncbi:MAG: hypothetical protein Fur0010_09310 [Bdellovibrio sp.]
MIAIQSENGELIKVLKNVWEGEFGFHRSFGFISKERAKQRVQTRKRHQFDFTKDEWLCSFKIQGDKNKGFNLMSLDGCEAIRLDNGWSIKTPNGVFSLVDNIGGSISPLLEEHPDNNEWMNKVLVWMFLLIFLIIPIVYFMTHEVPVEKKEEEKIVEPITVQIVKQVKTVKIENTVNPKIDVKPIDKAEVSKRAVQRNLGFLGMVGSKDLSKVTGGVPQELKQATAGAGPGGDAGSGGEVLTGLGKGLKKTTVGNTGVQGLGGIGTKGAGGGLGGYGNTLVASGEGTGISAIAVSSNDMVLEGGISRYAINATIAKYLNQVRRCYEAELKNNPDLQGLVEMNFEINATGRLNYSKVSKTTLNSPPVETCISKRMMDWQFPKPKGGVNVNVKYPFMLRPVGN